MTECDSSPKVATGTTFVLPVYNGERTLDAALTSILTQDSDDPIEVLVIDDGSLDTSAAIAERHLDDPRVQLLRAEGKGAAAAINQGIRRAKYATIAQVDQDMVLQERWLLHLQETLDQRSEIAAAQALFLTERSDGLYARVMGLDLTLRYRKKAGPLVDHVCTGNTLYRYDALEKVGLLDAQLGYGYDNDLSYRLGNEGYLLARSEKAASIHRWRIGAWGYFRQQYGVGYGRLDLMAKHPKRIAGDQVSGLGMIVHAGGFSLALALLGLAGFCWALQLPWIWAIFGSGLIMAALSTERLITGIIAAINHSEPAGLFFMPAHLLRDSAWAAAISIWLLRRMRGRASRPLHSMWRVDK
jgi:hypothetical protein